MLVEDDHHPTQNHTQEIWDLYVCMYASFGQGSSLLWTHTLRPFYSRPTALTQEGRSQVDDVWNVCVTEGRGGVSRHKQLVRHL